MKEKPSYYSLITADVRYDNRLTADEKLLFSEITALTESTGKCWASNQYFSELYDVTTSTISRRISKLKKYGYIDTEIVYKPNSREIDKRIITIGGIDNSVNRYCVETQGGIDNSVNRGIDAKRKENNTSIEYYKNNNISPIVPLEKWFEEFWSCYPKKVGKSVAKKSYEKKVTSEQIHNQILKDLEKREHYEQWKKNNGQFILNPSTYLNQERWKDEYEISMTGSTQLDEWGQLYQKYKENET